MARVDRFNLAFPVECIVSAYEAPLVFPLPLAQPGILGAVNVRGVPVAISDIRRSLRLNAKAVELDDRLLLVRVGDVTVGVIIDEVRTLIDLCTDELAHPATLFGDIAVNSRIVAGIACAPEPCVVIDIEGLVLPDVWTGDIEVPIDQTAEADAPLVQRTALLGKPPATESEAGMDVATFGLSDQRYAVPVSNVVEFFNGASHSPLPCKSILSASLINRRGEALALYDVRSLLGLTQTRLSPHVDGIVLDGAGFKVAVAVDSLEGLRTLRHPALTAARPSQYCLSVYSSEEGTIQLLDVAALTSAPQLALSNGGIK